MRLAGEPWDGRVGELEKDEREGELENEEREGEAS